jgi:hypothetical protein
MLMKNPELPNVVILTGNEKQQRHAAKVNGLHLSPEGNAFKLMWEPNGYHFSASTNRQLEKAVCGADFLGIGPRLSTLAGKKALEMARQHGAKVFRLPGGGTGVSGILRAAGEAVDCAAVHQ